MTHRDVQTMRCECGDALGWHTLGGVCTKCDCQWFLPSWEACGFTQDGERLVTPQYPPRETPR